MVDSYAGLLMFYANNKDNIRRRAKSNSLKALKANWLRRDKQVLFKTKGATRLS
jgi:hypothetical protein